jgi:hypothetical protein
MMRLGNSHPEADEFPGLGSKKAAKQIEKKPGLALPI